MKFPRFPLVLTAIAILAMAGSVRATVLVELAGGYLKDENGSLITANTGTLMLVASTSDSLFSSISAVSDLTVGSTLNGGTDDIVLYKSTISGDGYIDGIASAGEFRQAITLTLSMEIPEGSVLQLYWFPSLDVASTSAAAGNYYGTYRSTVPDGVTDADGGEAWYLPADGSSGYELLFLTSDAGSAINVGGSGAEFGAATNIVAVPEPAAFCLLAVGFIALVWRRSRRSAS